MVFSTRRELHILWIWLRSFSLEQWLRASLCLSYMLLFIFEYWNVCEKIQFTSFQHCKIVKFSVRYFLMRLIGVNYVMNCIFHLVKKNHLKNWKRYFYLKSSVEYSCEIKSVKSKETRQIWNELKDKTKTKRTTNFFTKQKWIRCSEWVSIPLPVHNTNPLIFKV